MVRRLMVIGQLHWEKMDLIRGLRQLAAIRSKNQEALLLDVLPS